MEQCYKSRVTEKDVNEFLQIVQACGYWSEEVKQFLSKFDHWAMRRLHERAELRLQEINPDARLR